MKNLEKAIKIGTTYSMPSTSVIMDALVYSYRHDIPYEKALDEIEEVYFEREMRKCR